MSRKRAASRIQTDVPTGRVRNNRRFGGSSASFIAAVGSAVSRAVGNAPTRRLFIGMAGAALPAIKLTRNRPIVHNWVISSRILLGAAI